MKIHQYLICGTVVPGSLHRADEKNHERRVGQDSRNKTRTSRLNLSM